MALATTSPISLSLRNSLFSSSALFRIKYPSSSSSSSTFIQQKLKIKLLNIYNTAAANFSNNKKNAVSLLPWCGLNDSSQIARRNIKFILTPPPPPGEKSKMIAASGGRCGGRISPGGGRFGGRGGSLHHYNWRLPSWSGESYSSSGGGADPFGNFIVLLATCGFVGFVAWDAIAGPGLLGPHKTTVLKLQVGLLGSARSLQKDLSKMTKAADTSTQAGLSFVLTETVMALLRHPDYCSSGYSSADVKKNNDEAELHFMKISNEERAKFDEETLVNVNNKRREVPATQGPNGVYSEYIVVTVLVEAQGRHKLSAIYSIKDLKEALEKLGTIPFDKINAVEILWTPQQENDTLSWSEVARNYPLLRHL